MVSNSRLAIALGNELDTGEAEAIALATEVFPDVVLIDEKQGRRVARQAGLTVRGVLGVLIRAKAMAEIDSMSEEIEALRSRAGFFVATSLEADVLRSAGE